MKKHFRSLILFILPVLLTFTFISCNKPTAPTGDDTSRVNVVVGDAYVEKNFELDLNKNGETYRITKYIGEETSVIVPSVYKGKNVVSIAKRAFSGSKIKSIALHDGITGIGAEAFKDCRYLEKIELPGDLTVIEDYLFSGCYGLQSVTIGKNTQEIGSMAFEHCPNTLSVTISPENKKLVAYTGCIVDAETKTLVWGGVGAEIPASAQLVTSIGDNAFRGSTITNIFIPENIVSIGEYAFAGNNNLTTVEFDNECGVTELGNGIFRNCQKLSRVIFPDGLRKISSTAFGGCYMLSVIDLPKALESVDEHLFNDCNNITSLSVSEGNEKYRSENNCIIERATNTIVLGCGNSTIPAEGEIRIGSKAFLNCKGLGEMVIPSNVIEIGEYAFSGSGVTKVTVSANIKAIPGGAFRNCEYLDSVTISEGIEEIGERAFNGCNELGKISFPSTLKVIGDYAFAECNCISQLNFPEGTVKIGKGAFDGCVALKQLSIPGSVETVGARAFAGCITLNEVSIAEGVKNIGNAAFYECIRLAPLTLPTSIEQFGSNVFYGCNMNNFTKYQNAYYAGNESLPYMVLIQAENGNVEIHPDTRYVAQGAFSNSVAKELTIPETITKLDAYMFSGSSLMDTVNVHSGVTYIGEYVFDGCGRLDTVNFDGTVAQWEAIEKADGWDGGMSGYVGGYTVRCTDGEVIARLNNRN